ncbi:hypothetical protein E2562_031990 [Oryza meyeriana var. granulata]|uniref:Uncharacterized protein n=1 Tax=Oryza meyeriana var. granulata TaxID=110450 RepID=A0A6G1F087_9ORYZ|nr:hypothetical protein E2562_031990 [Oryza meyeriana var. granulata]
MATASSLGLLLLLTTTWAWAAPAAVSVRRRNVVTHVKGFEGRLPFQLETGYVEVEEQHGVELFYYFIHSQRRPADDPLILWITGGPGCSALSGLLFEIGPLKFDVAGYTEGFPRLVYFQDSWTKVSNVIFLDAPVGTGFSYARDQQGYNVSLTQTGRHLVVFLTKWLADHPEFASNPLYIGGDSYSGYTVPVTALEIANDEDARAQLNLKGYLVGNAATDLKYDDGGKVPFMHGMGLISDEMYEAARSSCRGDYVSTPTNADCANALQAINSATFAINPVHILEPMCGLALSSSSREPEDVSSSLLSRTRIQLQRRRAMPEQQRLGLPVECRDNGYRLSYLWADDPEVRATLGIHNGSIGAWSRCTSLPQFRHDVESAIPYHADLTQRGYRALVYNGDHDLDMTFVGTQAWIRTLGYPVVSPWRPWYSNRQVAGFTTVYAHNLTFATVKGGGHTAPEYRPKECLDMLDRWTSPAGQL